MTQQTSSRARRCSATRTCATLLGAVGVTLSGWSAAAAQTVEAGHIAVTGDEMRTSIPDPVLYASPPLVPPTRAVTPTPPTDLPYQFMFSVSYTLDERAARSAQRYTAWVLIERETGGYGSEQWERLWSESVALAPRGGRRGLRPREGAFASPGVVQQEPVVRYRISLGASTTDRPGRHEIPYGEPTLVHVVRWPQRGERHLAAVLAVSRSAASVYAATRDLIAAVTPTWPDRRSAEVAAARFRRDLMAHLAVADHYLAQWRASWAAGVADDVADRLHVREVFPLVDFLIQTEPFVDRVTTDLNRAIAERSYATAMRFAAEELSDYAAHELAFDAASSVVEALAAHGYRGGMSAARLAQILGAAERDLAAYAAELRVAGGMFETGARLSDFRLTGSRSSDEAARRGRQLFELPRLAVVTHVLSIAALRAGLAGTEEVAAPGREYRPYPPRRRWPDGRASLRVTAANDRPGPVEIEVLGFDDRGATTVTAVLVWDADDNRYATRTIEIPGATRILRLTFVNDLYEGRDADDDRNAYIDRLDIVAPGVRYGVEGEDFDRTGGLGGPYSGCSRQAARSVVSGSVADCGNPGDFVEYDLPPLSGR